MQPASPDQLDALPRLLYVGDVPVEGTVGGSALIHRLLHEYPPDRLKIIEPNGHASNTERRLPGVSYQQAQLHNPRWLNSRVAPWYSLYLTCKPWRSTAALVQAMGDFKPEAVLTVAHGYVWFTAARLAQQLNVPLYLIVHDDWTQFTHAPAGMRSWIHSGFARAYRSATTRLCVCDNMAEEYERRYGLPGVALYPGRTPDIQPYTAPPERLGQTTSGTALGFIGSIYAREFAKPMYDIAKGLAEQGGSLHIWSPQGGQVFEQHGWLLPNMVFHEPCFGQALLEQLREQVDVLFLPNPFTEASLVSVSMLFPSKLTDYTAVGLPIVAWGPPVASGVRWVKEHLGVQAVVEEDSPQPVLDTLQSLASDPQQQLDLGRKALAAGADCFSYESIRDVFFEQITKPRDAARAN